MVALWHPRGLPEAVETRLEAPVPAAAVPARRQVFAKRTRVAEFDRRTFSQSADSAWPADRRAALAALQAVVPEVQVDFTGSGAGPPPVQVQAAGRFLTAPAPGTAAKQVVADYLDRYPPIFGLDGKALAASRLIRDDVTAHNGMTTLVWQQEIDGIPVFEAVFKASVTKSGELINAGGHFIGTPGDLPAEARTALIAAPPVTAEGAVTAAAAALGDVVTEVRSAGAASGSERRQPFTAGGVSDVQAHLTWLPMSATSAVLAWDVTLMSLKRNEMFRLLIDVQSGEPVVLRSLTNDISNASYRVFADGMTLKPLDSPRPFSPGHSTPSTGQAPEVARTLITTPALDTAASPNGWIDDGGTTTVGNNVAAHTDLDANNVADLPRPDGGAGRNFDFSMDLAQPPSTYRDASVTQLFYYCNWMHDRLYQLGFTESAGNFQTNNFGLGGLGNDAVLADAQDGFSLNNANFSTPADGSPGRMQMFVFSGPTPDIDGDFDGEIVLHEYAHGLSNRLVGGGVGMSAPQSRGQGEGWSDFYGLALLSEPGDDVNGTYASGAYATYQLAGMTQNYYFGIRRYPYSTDLLKNPLTFKDIDPTQASAHAGVLSSPIAGPPNADPAEVHNVGEVWCMTLWEARASLITKHGYAIGNERMLRLVTDGMKLSPANPTFVQSRNAILQADLVNNGGADRAELWAAFAKRGLGVSAYAPASSTTTGVIEAFDLPGDLDVSPTNPFLVSQTSHAAFVPASITYTLTNNGSTPLDWTAAKTQSWSALSSAGGTLAPGASVPLVWSLDSAVTNFLPGSYTDTLTITDTTHAVVKSRPLQLTMNPSLTPVMVFPLNSDPGWPRAGQWAYGQPLGLGGTVGVGSGGLRDPNSGATGTKVFGINLAGNYTTSTTGTQYLTAGPFDLTGFIATNLRFKRWLNSDDQPFVTQTIDVSSDGLIWTNIWNNGSTDITASSWTAQTHPLGAGADNQEAVYIRWGHQTFSGSVAFSGWNVDDIEILAHTATSALVATAQAVATGFETPVAVTLSGTVTPSAPLTFSVVDQPEHGALSGAAPDLLYTPEPGFAGADTIRFTVSSGGQTSLPATVIVTVLGTTDIAVEQPEGSGLTDGVSTVDYGAVPVGSVQIRRFIIANNGNDLLTLGTPTRNGVNAAEFTLGALSGAALQPGETAFLDVTFAPAATGSRTAMLHIPSNDPDESSFDITLTGSGFGAVGEIQLMRDINPQPFSLMGGTAMVAMDGFTFFVGTTIGSGSELWRTDGTAAGTFMVKDINPGAVGSNPTSLVRMGNRVYFSADNATNGIELWASDGTAANTVMVRDISVTGNSSPASLTVLGSTLYFSAADTNGNELWKSDGTQAGTVMVANINSGSASSSPANLAVFGSLLYFSATNGSSGIELWKSNGTAAGTVQVKDIAAGSGNSSPANFTPLGSVLLFSAFDSTNGTELWKSDGTDAGTVLVTNLNPGSNNSNPHSMVVLSGLAYFRATTTALGTELFVTDGTAAGTQVLVDFLPGSSTGLFSTLTQIGDEIYFMVADSVTGAEAWKSDGTVAGTQLVADISPGTGNSSPSNFRLSGGTIYFTATDGDSGIELYRTDGTPAGTRRVKDIWPGTAASSPTLLTDQSGLLIFSADDGITGRELWVSDGTEAGTRLVGDFATGSASTTYNNLRGINGSLYFSATDLASGTELWRSTGTPAGTLRISDIQPGSTASSPSNYVGLGSAVIFSAFGSGVGTELYRTDGTLAGTALLKDITPGGVASSPANLTTVGSVVYFAANDGTNGTELWKTDGTTAGTVLVKNINVIASASSNPANISDFGNGTVFFTATEGVNGIELWKSDGTDAGTVLVKDINAGSTASSPANFTLYNGLMYFSATTATSGNELWRSDGTAAGTVQVADIGGGSASSSPTNLMVINGALLFNATTTAAGQELWKWDGTSATLVKDIWSGTSSSVPSNFVNLNGTLLFRANGGSATGNELWKSDGTTAGTVQVKDIAPGAGHSSPAFLVAVGTHIYFRADTPNEGSELWKSDGTDAGTTLVGDIYPGAESSSPLNVTRAGNYLFFTARSPTLGIELFMVDASPPTEIAVEQPAGTNLTDGSASIDFGTASVAVPTNKTFTVKNLGGVPLAISGITVDGASAGSFSAGEPTVNPIPGGGSATFTVAFSPLNNGAKTAALHILSNDADEASFDIALTGTGTGEPEIQVERPAGTILVSGSATANFGSVNLGSSSPLVFTVRNQTAGTNLALTAPVISGAGAADFAVNAAGMSGSVAGGGSTTFTVTFAPMAAGARGATLSLANSDFDENPFVITLSGTGAPVAGPAQTILGPATLPVRFASGGPFSLPYFTTSGLPVSMAVVAGGGVGSLSGNVFTPSDLPGSVTIRISQAGGGGYNAAPDIYRTFIITSTQFVKVAQGSQANASAGIQADGSLWAWGSGSTGMLGVSGAATRNPAPLRVGIDTNWTQVAMGGNHTLALKSDGTLWAWGFNTNGQVGDGTTSQRSTPVQIGTATNWAFVSAGGSHSLAVKTDGTLWAWGLNTNNQLGDGSATQRTSPVQLGVATNWATVSAGGAYSLATRTDGTLWAWGLNGANQLGLGDTTTRTTPTQVGSAVTWSQVTATTNSSYAIRTDGTLWAWGSNSSFHLGDGTSTSRNTPTQIGTAVNWKAVAAGANSHAVGLRTDGTLWSWGSASSGQTAHGNSGTRTVPTQIGTATDWVAIGAGGTHTTAVKANGTVWAAGLNSFGQIAYPLANISHIASANVKMATQGLWHTHFIRQDGTLWGIGTNFSDLGDGTTTLRPQPVQIGTATNWRQVAAGNGHNIAVRTDGTLWGNGGNTNGQVGDASTTTRSSFVQIGGTSDWAKVAAGYSHSTAIKNDGSLWTWGANSSSQLGHGDTTQRTAPTRVGAANNWAAVAAGASHTLALKTDGTLWAWGLNGNGQLGLGDTTLRNTPTQVGSDTDWVQISAGNLHSLGLKANGTVWSWGGNTSLQIGDGTASNRLTPFQMSAASNWTAIFAGTAHSVAVNAKGEMWACGQNTSGQLGNMTSNSFNTLTLTAPVAAWKALSSGPGTFTLAITEDGSLWGMGTNADSQFTDSYRLESQLEYGHPNIALQTVTVPPVVVGAFGTPVALNGTATSGLPVSYAVSGPATVTGTQLTVTGPGEVKLLAWQRGDRPAWHSSPPVQVPVLSAPAATTLPATALTFTTAALNGTAFAGGQSTTVSFDYDTDISDGSYAFSAAATPGTLTGGGVTPVTAALSGLTAGMTYHVRVRAVNAQGTTLGANVPFTLPVPKQEISMFDGTVAGTALTDGTGSVAFGSVLLGAAGTPRTFTIQNAGQLDLTGITVTASGDWSVNTSATATTVPAGGTTTFTATFTPSADGVRTGSLQVFSNDEDEGTFDIAVAGTGIGPDIAVEQPVGAGLVDGSSTTAFGGVPLGSSVVKTFLVRNAGGGVLSLGAITRDGANAADFHILPGGGADLAAGQSTSFDVVFAPAAAGAKAAVLHIASNDPNENGFDINLSGSGVVPSLPLNLVADINATAASSSPANFAFMDGFLYFAATSPATGVELWRSNGTAAGTALVSDIRPGSGSSSPAALRVVGSTLFFIANDGVAGAELWKSDGTAAGTVLVRDILPGATGSSVTSLAVFGTGVAFAASTSFGAELFVSDGTEAGTFQVRDIFPGVNSGSPSGIVNAGGILYFAASDGVTGSELWRSDGTEAGTWQVKDINPGSAAASITSMTVVNGTVFFAATDGVNGAELWQSEGTAETTVMVANLNAGSASASPANFTVTGATLYFTANNGTNGVELWKCESGVPTMVSDINSGSASSSPTLLVNVDGTLYFTATLSAFGQELWKSDGTAAGTVLVKDIRSGTTTSSPAALTAVGSVLYLTANDGVTGTELWKSDGTAAGTTLVKDISAAATGSTVTSLFGANGVLYFRANDGISGLELWVSNGTAAGTLPVADIATGTADAAPTGLAALNNGVIFSADDGVNGGELWRSDGSPGGTVLVRDINTGSLGGYTGGGALFGSEWYFQGFAGTTALWKTDGTTAGTVLVTNMGGGANLISSILVTESWMYFAINKTGFGIELWRSDGTAAGTVMVKDINPGTGNATPSSLTAVGSTIYFSASDASNGTELWRTDGTDAGTVMVKNINPGSSSSSPSQLKNVDGVLYFLASDGVTGAELWKSDGTEAGTVRVRDIEPGAAPGPSGPLASLNGTLVFAAMSGFSGTEVWKSDGTEAGTVLVKDIAPLGFSSSPANFVSVNGVLLFTATDGINGTELWRTDGTTAGTFLVRDIEPQGSSAPAGLTVINGLAYFRATTLAHGTELWCSDGTAAGTVLVADLFPGAASSSPANFTLAGNKLFFTAQVDGKGIELHTLDLGGSPDIAVEQPAGANLIDGIASVDFGGISTGGSTVKTLTVRNTGSGMLTVSNVTRDGPDAGSFTVSPVANANIPASAASTFTVTFAPAATGPKSAFLRIASNDPEESPFDIALTGSGQLPPDIAIELPPGTPLASGGAPVAFGQVALGGSAVKTLTLRNHGPGTLNGLALQVSGAHSADFAIGSLSATTLAAGGSLTFDVTYSPTGGGLRTALLQVASNDPDEAPFLLHLTGSNLLEIAFDHPAHIPLTANGYAAPSGLGLGVNLAFMPQPGVVLTLVNNTSAAPITQQFTGVAEGGIVGADHGGHTYYFHVSYAGGDGNDLVLTEAYRWTWMKGSSAGEVASIYGELGVPAAANSPGSRYSAHNWTDSAGRLWLFGGEGFITTSRDALNDLWMFDPPTRTWTWQGGTTTRFHPGVYGQQGVAAPENVPSGRLDGVTWTDDNGRFWLFGGRGSGNLNDLWCFDPVSRLWTWMGGPTAINTPGVYGTKGVAAAANWPGARYNSLTWQDREGNIWLFGGSGVAATPSSNVLLNDLWKFSPATGQWTWVSGSDGSAQNGHYGTLGVASMDACPGARGSPCGWVGAQGELWLFGGSGHGASNTTARRLNDLWRFDPETAQWTWMGGSQEADEPAVPAELLKPSLTALPSARSSPAAWTDARGRFWLMGGYGFRVGNNVPVELNDVWMFDPATSFWTWVRGSTTERAVGIYGEQGVATADAAGGVRTGATVFPTSEASGDVWVFGGTGIATAPDIRVSLNDLWKLDMPDLPALTPGAVTGIPATGTGATLNAALNPNGKASRLSFVVGTTPDLANAVQLPVQNFSAGSANLPVAQPLTGLATATTYFYRLQGANYSGPSFSELRSFTTPAVPDIALEQPAGTGLVTGAALIDFGTVVKPASQVLTFTLRNTGTAALADLAAAVTGAQASEFTVANVPQSLAAGASTTFTVTFAPADSGVRSAKLELASNDPDEAPFLIDLQGYGLLPQSITFDAIGQQSCGTPLVLGATAGSGLSVSYAITAGGGIAGLTGNTVTFTAPGSVTIEATQAGDATYAAAQPVSRTFEVVKGDQVITFDPGLPNTISFSATVNLAATSSRGLTPVTFSVISGPGQLTGATLSFTGPGDVVVQASQSGNIAFNPGSAQKTITAFNTPPVAAAGAGQGNEDTLLTGNATATDAQGTSLTYAKVSDPSHGVLTFNADGSFSYQPALNFNGADSFTFKANDGLADSNTATITLTVHAVNDAPVASAGSASGNEDAASIGGTASATDVDTGTTLTYSKVADPANGTVTVNANGTYSYVPALNFNGTDSFTFKANDGVVDSNTATITVTVQAVNDAPVAVAASASGNEDAAAITGTVTATDVDAGATLTFSKVTDPAHGTATVNADGTFSYTPAANYNGPDSFTAKANDGTADSNVVTVTITVQPVNDAPTVVNGAASGDEDTVITGTLQGSDIDAGDTLTFLKVADPAHGSVVIAADGGFTYTPDANYNGPDSFTFKANDGNADSNVGTVTLTLGVVNDAPVADNGAGIGDEDNAITGSLSATDVDLDTLTFAKVAGPAHGSVIVNAGGTYTYTPDLNYNGPDSFTFKANDGLDDSNVATVSLTLAAVNDAPVAANAAASGSEDSAAINGTVTASDVENDALTFSKVSDPAHGAATVTAEGGFTYVPAADFNGSDSFTVKAHDGALDSNVVTVTITVGPVNDAPIATNGSGAADEDHAITGTLAASDIDTGDVLTYIKLTEPTQGAVSVDSATGAYTYTPNANSNGADSFTFKVNDGLVDSNTATISLTISAVNDAPVVTDASAVGVEGNLVRGVVTGTDIENSPLTFSLVADAGFGSATVNADGSFSYRPDPEFVGTDTFTFQASDGTDLSNIGAVTIVITTILPEWTWMKGSNLPNQKGVSSGAAAAPGARQGSAAWTDADGNFWLFGGSGHGKTTGPGPLSDLWQRAATTGAWTLIKGGEEINAPGTYGVLGKADAANTPGARSGAATWVDSAGRLWLFGGTGRDSAGATGVLNDLWQYDPAANAWTWIKGPNLVNNNGSFGALGTPAGSNQPSARGGAVTWTDTSGGLWLFGGRGIAATGTKVGNLNDLWRYDSESNQWTWMKGASALDTAGSYGTQGLATATTQPGARADAAAWVDSFGNFWLFGGAGFAAGGAAGNLSDLWQYDPSMNQWTWVRGAAATGGSGVYGSLGIPAPASQPGARTGATAWADATGCLWLFGGSGNAATGSGQLSDVWRYDPSSNIWTWMKGSSATNGAAAYGTLGVASPANTPSARRAAAAFADGNGDLWLLAGINGTNHFNDLWRLDLPPAPVVRVLPADAGLRAAITSNGLDTTARFRYSRNRDLSDALDTPEQFIGPEGGEITAPLSGLLESTTYYYQAIATNAFGTGVSRLLSFTTPGAPVTPTAGFVQASMQADEDAGTVSLMVKLDVPSAASFTIPFTISGSATPGAAADYTAPVSPLSFVAGQTMATISIPVRDDVLDENDETIIVTLGTPTGTVTLGAITELTLTLVDNDTAIVIGTPPQSQFAVVGADTTLSVAATGSGVLTYQWKKNGTNINGATGSTYVIAGTPLTANGNYSVEIKNPVGTELSPAAELSVIDAADRTLAIAPNGTATMTVAAASPGLLEYQWFLGSNLVMNSGTRITGATSKTVVIKQLSTADAGAYTCVVTRAGTLRKGESGVNTLAIVTLKPAVLPIDTLPTAVVGAAYEFQIPVNANPAMVPSGFAVTGLPAGLTVSATGLISGRPTAAVVNKALSITAKNSAGTSPAEPCTLTILPLPAAVTGVYIVQVDPHAGINAGHGARIDLTTTTAGGFSGKLTLVERTIPFSDGLLTTVHDDSIPVPVITSITGTVLIPRTGQAALQLTFALDGPSNTLSGTLTDTGTGFSAPVGGCRNPWHATTNKAGPFTGYYTLGLEIPATAVGDQSIPQGNGFGSFTVKADGTLTFAGQTADGLSFSVATFVSADGDIPVFAPFTTVAGSLLGVPRITPSAAPAYATSGLFGALSWSKTAAPAASKSRAYRAGFGPLALTVIGGKYAPPAAGQVVMGLPNSAGNARLTFAEGGLLPGQCPPLTFSIRNTNANGVTQTITLPPAAANPNKITFALAANPAGQFSGKFTLPHSAASLVRTTAFQGIIVRNGSVMESMGYYLLSELPQPGQTLATSPQLSGQSLLVPAAAVP